MKMIPMIIALLGMVAALRILWICLARYSRCRFRSAMIGIKRDMFRDPRLYGIFDDVEPYIRKQIREKQ